MGQVFRERLVGFFFVLGTLSLSFFFQINVATVAECEEWHRADDNYCEEYVEKDEELKFMFLIASCVLLALSLIIFLDIKTK